MKIFLKKICCRADQIDSNGNMFTKEALEKCSKDSVPVSLNYDQTQIVGHANTYFKDGNLCCDLYLIDELDCKGLKAGPELKVTTSNRMMSGCIVTDCEIKSVGLFELHADKDIEPLCE